MMTKFRSFAININKQYNHISERELYRVDIDGDALFEKYLSLFPEGTNPIFREKTEHDCSACRNFIRNLGNVVAISDDYRIITVWDNYDDLEYPFSVVAKCLSTYIGEATVNSIFRSKTVTYGLEKNSTISDDGSVETYHHFWGEVKHHHASDEVDAATGHINTTVSVFKRALDSITSEAVSDVLDLIDNGNLYRGREHASSVNKFSDIYTEYNKIDVKKRNNFVWRHCNSPVARIRNSVIGTLLVDLSEGVDLDVAVSNFEAKVAPSNYKRPKALITPRMIDAALSELRELDLEASVERRFANLSDVSVNDVIWASGSAAGVMLDGLKESLLSSSKVKRSKVNTDRAIDIDITGFVSDVLPSTSDLEIMISNNHIGNFVSLSAPVHLDSKPIFKWDNNFAWSYYGNTTDTSIKERVNLAGGKTDGILRVSLAWHNSDDLDLHCITPHGNHIYYGNKREPGHLELDVDMNISGENPKDPVENIYFYRIDNGKYQIRVNNYTRRNYDDTGFTLEVESKDFTRVFKSAISPQSSCRFDCINIHVKNGEVTNIEVIDSNIRDDDASRDIWGVRTEEFSKVTTVMLSPNHWGSNSEGNKHFIFTVANCENPDPIRGIYNEYLRNDLYKHRKVFEVLGAKTMCGHTKDQVSGLGFSTTISTTVVVKADNMLYNVKFNKG